MNYCPLPRRSLVSQVRSPTWVVLCALAERVSPDGTVRVSPAALARTLSLSTQNIFDAVDELVERGAARVVVESPFGSMVVDISGALTAAGPADTS